jgi:hypothetical protein
MEMNDQDCIAVVEPWLPRLNEAIRRKPNDKVDSNLAGLFQGDSYWRDALALRWRLQTVTHNESIRRTLRALTIDIGITDLQIEVAAAPPLFIPYPKISGAVNRTSIKVHKNENRTGAPDDVSIRSRTSRYGMG